MRALLRLLLPGAPIAAAVVAVLPELPWGRPLLVEGLTADYALPVHLAALALAAAFHRSRVFALLLVVASWGAGVRSSGWDGTAASLAGAAVLSAVVVGAWSRDRALTSRRGMIQIGVAVALTAGCALVVSGVWGDASIGLLAPVGEGRAARSPWEVWSGVPDLLGVLAGLALASSVLAAFRWRAAVERALPWVVLGVVGAAHPATGAPSASLLLIATSLTLGLSVLETSYAMAYRDELTGLPARRALVRDLEALGGPYTIAMVDVDHFKKFNDRHGHDVGDQVLRLVAGRLARAPGGGRAYRYGGEEFTLLYPGLTKAEAVPHLEVVRESVASARFALRRWTRPFRNRAGRARRGGNAGKRSGRDRSGRLKVTVSLGVADSSEADRGGAESVLKRADKALYRAKKAGRNRVST